MRVSLEGVTKVYPNGVRAVSDLDLDVADGELMVLVGPSGCGKTTALRMVAGLEDVTEGTIRIGDGVVNELPPRDRDVAMVFQNYALYPHMTVADNIGFALKLRKVPRSEIDARVEEAARILGLTDHLRSRPAQLSGGQRQRVAMGRAIVREPAAFLMDEPLSNLDAKLRVQMRAEISRIQRRLGVATLYVTHDQTEAMTLGDRVAVMRGGILQQCDAPQVVYDQPANIFVAAFIGSPAMNLYAARLSPAGTELEVGDQRLEVPQRLRGASAVAGYRDRDLVVGIRPEHLEDAALGPGAGPGRRLEGDVELVEALGSEKLAHFRIEADRVQEPEARSVSGDAPGGGEIGTAASTVGVARVAAASDIKAGQRRPFAVDTERLILFDRATGRTIG